MPDSTNDPASKCVTINIYCGEQQKEQVDQLLVDIQSALLGTELRQVKEFRQRGGRLDVLDVTGSSPRPEHAGRLACSAPVDGGGIGFAKCVNNWFKANPDGCGKIFHEDGNWCFTEGCG